MLPLRAKLTLRPRLHLCSHEIINLLNNVVVSAATACNIS
jgi:hypothetical protein